MDAPIFFLQNSQCNLHANELTPSKQDLQDISTTQNIFFFNTFKHYNKFRNYTYNFLGIHEQISTRFSTIQHIRNHNTFIN